MFLLDKLQIIAKHGKSNKQHIALLLLKHRFTIHRYSLQDFGKKAQCSRSTVERFCKYLGYQRFTDLKTAIFDGLRSTAKTHEWLLNSNNISDKDLLSYIFSHERSSLRNIATIIQSVRYLQLLESLSKAEKVYILGAQASSPMAHAYAYEIGKIHKNVILIDYFNEITTHIISSANKQDTAFIFGFPRFPCTMIQFTKLLFERGCKNFLFSHTLGSDSPFQPYAHITFRIYLHYYGFTTGYSPLTALLSHIVLMYCRLYPKEAQESIRLFESALHTCNNFYSSKRKT